MTNSDTQSSLGLEDNPGNSDSSRKQSQRSSRKDNASAGGGSMQDEARDFTENLKSAGQAGVNAAKQQASRFGESIRSELKAAAEERKSRGAEAITGFSKAVDRAAGELEKQSPGIARAVHEAATSMEDFSRRLRDENVESLWNSAKRFAQRQPGVFFAGSLIAGFALSRFLMSSPPTQPQSDPASGRFSGSQEGFSGSRAQSFDPAGSPQRPGERSGSGSSAEGATTQSQSDKGVVYGH